MKQDVALKGEINGLNPVVGRTLPYYLYVTGMLRNTHGHIYLHFLMKILINNIKL